MEAIKAILRKVLYWGRYLCTVKRRYNEPPGGGTWVFLGWVCAARDFKLAPRSKKNFP